MQLLSLRGELFLAKIPENPQHILDCGTGTGIWALDVGEVYPSAEVIGVDLSSIQPEWYVAFSFLVGLRKRMVGTEVKGGRWGKVRNSSKKKE